MMVVPVSPASPSPLPEPLLQALQETFQGRVSTQMAVRDQHGRDESYHPGCPPQAVVFVENTHEVSAAVTLCAKYRVPIIPFGTGTSLEGGVAALRGGVCLDLSGLDRVLRFSAEDMDVTVEAGVTRKRLNDYLRDTGLFFPIDPGADASLGGMAATRASGTNAVRYGTMRDAVLGLTVVTADGGIVHTGGRARKSAAGYDLTRLFIGQEGTLGIITELTLRLWGIPEAMAAAVCGFPSVAAAVNTVIATIQNGVPMARIEFLDAVQMDAVNRYSCLDYPVVPTLFFEFHGTAEGVEAQSRQVEALAAENGGSDFCWATRPEERSRLWQARHNAYYASLAYKPGRKGWTTDVCVPIARLADCIEASRQDLEQSFLVAPMVGHVGDGNFHMTFLIDPDDPADMAEAERLNDRLVRRALSMGGTCTGEHGIGYGKMAYLALEHPEGLPVMRRIKQALDPENLLNPGKVVG